MNNHLNMLPKQAKFDLKCSKMRWRLRAIFYVTSLISPHYLVKHKSAKFVHKASRRWCASAIRNLAALKSI